MNLISHIQSRLESLYAIKVGEQVHDYLIGHEELRALMPLNARTNVPRELFLVNPRPENSLLEVALFLDPELRKNLEINNPFNGLTDQNISDFCTLIEGVSHFVYYIHKSLLAYDVTQLEMELQAEIDKFLLLVLCTPQPHQNSKRLLSLLFENYSLEEALTPAQKERYRTASNLARKYCFELSKKLKKSDLPALFKEVRQFYPLTQEEKIRRIMQ